MKQKILNTLYSLIALHILVAFAMVPTIVLVGSFLHGDAQMWNLMLLPFLWAGVYKVSMFVVLEIWK